MKSLLTFYGLKYSPFRPDVPCNAFKTNAAIDSFLRRMQLGITDGGFALITGDPGTGKSVVLRLLTEKLREQPDVIVGNIEHPQNCTSDFYRELGDLYGVAMTNQNRWAGFKALRTRWCDHIQQTRLRPVLILDEAQEISPIVLNELRILASKDLDSKQLLTVIFAGDSRLLERFRTPELSPLGSRIRRRIHLDDTSAEDLLVALDHLLDSAGNSALMSVELKRCLTEHACGNYRVLMNLADELLMAAFDKKQPQLDEKIFLDLYASIPKPKQGARKR